MGGTESGKGNAMNKEKYVDRKQNYDLLRILSAISIILIHLGDDYGVQIVDGEPDYYFSIGNLCLTLTVYAVPCFVMLSGAFLLSNPGNKNIRKFYKKSFCNLFLPALIISGLYVLYNIIKLYYHIGRGMAVVDTPLTYLSAWLKGEPFYHMWYIYMILGIYALVPFLVIVKEQISQKAWQFFSIFCLVISVILWKTTSFGTHWGLESIVYLGYFLVGDVIRSKFEHDKKRNLNTNLIVGILILFGYALFREYAIRNGLQKFLFGYMGNFHPVVMIASVQIFIGFSRMHIKKDVSGFAKRTLYIYLIHAGVIDVLYNIVPERWNPVLFIPCMLAMTLVLTYIAATFLIFIQDKISLQFSQKEQIMGKKTRGGHG